MSLAITAGVVGVAGAGLSAYGALSQPGGISTAQIPATGYNASADPLLSALSLNAGAGIGQFDPNTYMQASPTQQLLAQALSSGQITQRKYRLLQESLNANPQLLQQASQLKGKERRDFLTQNGLNVQQIRGLQTAERLAQSAGYENLGALHTANQQYLAKLPEIQAQFQPVADQLRKGLLASQGRIGGYLQNLPDLLTGEKNPFIDQLRNEALTSAQKYGYNPYQGLEQARSQALQRALQLIQGEQAVQGGQQQAALPIAQLRQQGGATAAQLGAGQAQMLAGALQSQQAAQAAQAQTWGNLGGNLIGAAGGLYGSRGQNQNQPSGPATGPNAPGGGGYPTENNYAVWGQG